jgi:hypothetical protein
MQNFQHNAWPITQITPNFILLIGSHWRQHCSCLRRSYRHVSIPCDRLLHVNFRSIWYTSYKIHWRWITNGSTYTPAKVPVLSTDYIFFPCQRYRSDCYTRTRAGKNAVRNRNWEQHWNRDKHLVELSATSTEVRLFFCPHVKYKMIPKFPVSNACFSGSPSSICSSNLNPLL